MQPKPGLYFGSIVLLSLLLCLNAVAQTEPPKKKLKDFGSSLDRLRWDPQKQSAEIDHPDAARQLDQDDVIRIDTTLIASDVLVVDQQGRSVSGLKAEDFIVTEDDAPQKVSHFLLGDSLKVPRSIVLIIDYSGSQFPYIKTSVEAAKTLVDKLNPLDRMAIVTDDVELLVDFTRDKKYLKQELDALVEKSLGEENVDGVRKRHLGKSQQYSALVATLNELFDDEDERPIVVFQTDGDEAVWLQNPIIELSSPQLPTNLPKEQLKRVQELLKKQRERVEQNRRQFSIDDVYRTAEKSRATIYTVISGLRYIGLSPDQQIAHAKADSDARFNTFLALVPADRRRLAERAQQDRDRALSTASLQLSAERNLKVQSALAAVAPLTGGWTDFLEDPAQADGIYSRIFSDINQRYIVGYYPTNKEFDGKRRKVKITVRDHPDYRVLGRKAYYAPGPGNK